LLKDSYTIVKRLFKWF